MRYRAGFTLIELLITITIMVILLTLAVVSLRSNQAHARDEERKTDVAVITQQLETYYQSGSDAASVVAGKYPPTTAMNSEATIKTTLRDIDTKTLRAPDVPTSSPISLTVAANNSSSQSPATNTYIYQPLTSTGDLCTSVSSECRKFVIYYALETDAAVQKVLSKNQ